MESHVLFSPADLHGIRRDVKARFAPSSAEQYADLVAAAIRSTIRSRLPEWPGPWRTRIADVLVRRCLVEERREIRPEDVVNVCSELGLVSAAEDSSFTDSLVNWLDEKAPGLWHEHEQQANRIFVSAELSRPSGIPDPKPMASRVPRAAWFFCSLALVSGLVIGVQLDRVQPRVLPVPESPPIALQQEALADQGIPPIFRYQPMDADAVKAYLISRDSLLAEEPYFSAIVSQAKAFDLNPLLLFAITGQEQGFVPKSNKHARKIANNPFNVYHSWQDFNTDISHSAEIAARTIVRRVANRPDGHDPFEWLNQTYAEDPNWARGVKKIFDKLSSLAASSNQS